MKIEEAAKAVAEAKSLYLAAKDRATAASLEETGCLNRLNQAQHRFDKVVEELRNEASVGRSDWGRTPVTP